MKMKGNDIKVVSKLNQRYWYPTYYNASNLDKILHLNIQNQRFQVQTLSQTQPFILPFIHALSHILPVCG